jgi:hypothetical protein
MAVGQGRFLLGEGRGTSGRPDRMLPVALPATPHNIRRSAGQASLIKVRRGFSGERTCEENRQPNTLSVASACCEAKMLETRGRQYAPGRGKQNSPNYKSCDRRNECKALLTNLPLAFSKPFVQYQQLVDKRVYSLILGLRIQHGLNRSGGMMSMFAAERA